MKYKCDICGAKIKFPVWEHFINVHKYIMADKYNKAIIGDQEFVWIAGDIIEPFLWNRRLW